MTKKIMHKTIKPGGTVYRLIYLLNIVPVAIGHLIDRIVGYAPMKGNHPDGKRQ